MAKGAAKSFQAALEGGDPRLGWVIVRIPFDVAKTWGTKGTFRVKGDVNGFAFRSALFPTGSGTHFLPVNHRMQKGGGVRVGEMARFRMEPDTAERTVPVPEELKRALAEDRALTRWFDKLSYSMRKYISEWVDGVKSVEARERRAMQIAERLLATIEAERELPPVLRLAFARDPVAAEGWKLMSESRRRGHLLGIFGYRDPKTQARRAARAVKDAFELAERKRKRQTGIPLD
jgi:uncharacterized protein YdeI (YjbR/CyaY-like superfamily)